MKGKSPVEIRMELARGHFLVGEPAHALAALEAAVREDPRHPGLRPLIEELLADPSTYTVRTSLDAVRARLGASVPPAAAEPVSRPRLAPVPVESDEESDEPMLELEPLAESAGLFTRSPAAPRPEPAPRPVAAKPAPAPRPAAKQPVETDAPARRHAGTIVELERWLRNVPRIKRTEVRA